VSTNKRQTQLRAQRREPAGERERERERQTEEALSAGKLGLSNQVWRHTRGSQWLLLVGKSSPLGLCRYSISSARTGIQKKQHFSSTFNSLNAHPVAWPTPRLYSGESACGLFGRSGRPQLEATWRREEQFYVPLSLASSCHFSLSLNYKAARLALLTQSTRRIRTQFCRRSPVEPRQAESTFGPTKEAPHFQGTKRSHPKVAQSRRLGVRINFPLRMRARAKKGPLGRDDGSAGLLGLGRPACGPGDR